MNEKPAVSIQNIKEQSASTTQGADAPAEVPRIGPVRAGISKRWAVIVAVFLGLCFGIGLFAFSDKVRLVKTVIVEQGPLVTTIPVTGKVVAAREVVLGATVSGTVASVYVSEGDVVTSKQPLATIDLPEARASRNKAEASLHQASEEFSQTQRTARNLNKLYEAGGEPRQVVEDAESRLRIAEVKVRVAREDLRVARIDLQNAVIRAPFGGLVTVVTAQVGQRANAGQGLITLVDPNEREIDAKADAEDGGRILLGQEAIVSSDAFPDRQWREQVRRLAPVIEKIDTTNSFSVGLSLGGEAPSLRLGQQVDVKIQIASKVNATKVPISALLRREGGASVAVVRDERIHFVQVQTGIEDLSHIEIVAGLQAGEHVVLPERKGFVEGERVKIANGGSS